MSARWQEDQRRIESWLYGHRSTVDYWQNSYGDERGRVAGRGEKGRSCSSPAIPPPGSTPA